MADDLDGTRSGVAEGETNASVQELHPMKIAAPLALSLLLVAGAAQAQAPAATAPAGPAVDPAAAGAAFLARNAADPAVKTLPSGLQYKVVKSGPAGGASPKVGDAVKVNYEGALINGEVFDSSFQRGKPELMILDNLIPAWIEAVPLMKVGDEWTLYAPPSLAYGERGVGPIPPSSVLVFRLQLLGTLSAD